MDGGVEGARDDQGAELRNRGRQRLRTRKRGGSPQIFRLEHSKEIDRVAVIVAGGGHVAQFPRKRAHRAEPRLLRCRGKGPRVAERHRAEAPRFAPTAGPHAASDVQERDAINGAAAELVRRAVLEVLEQMTDFEDPHVVGASCRHCGRAAERSPARASTGAAQARSSSTRREKRPTRYPTFAAAATGAICFRMPRMYSAASCALRLTNSIPAGSPPIRGKGWHNS